MPGGHSLPRSGLDHVDPGESVPGSLRLIQEASVEAGQPALMPDWYGRARSFYLPEWASVAPPPLNEELGDLWPVGNPAVSVSSRLLVQMEKV
ncbi:hypothetical protein E2C01_054933 [Portunus trituberculatus]|uniref:Uncharacterized protein n=1 Tax=Portunus trituberculatus TaxID=210409 RepID=A0A5B7GWA7_PORTR|nr:hypothetical protein [Portunus trituberculatus]